MSKLIVIFSSFSNALTKNFSFNRLTAPIPTFSACMYKVGQKTGLFLRSDNFRMTNDRKACNMSKVSEFCIE